MRRENRERGRMQRNNRGRRGRSKKPVGWKLHRHRQRRQWPEKDQTLGGVKVKWTQRVDERLTHLLNSNPDARKDIRYLLTDSDEAAFVDFVKDHEELYDKAKEHFKDKVSKDCLWERYASSRKLT